jgi:hypothetical protein
VEPAQGGRPRKSFEPHELATVARWLDRLAALRAEWGKARREAIRQGQGLEWPDFIAKHAELYASEYMQALVSVAAAVIERQSPALWPWIIAEAISENPPGAKRLPAIPDRAAAKRALSARSKLRKAAPLEALAIEAPATADAIREAPTGSLREPSELDLPLPPLESLDRPRRFGRLVARAIAAEIRRRAEPAQPPAPVELRAGELWYPREDREPRIF